MSSRETIKQRAEPAPFFAVSLRNRTGVSRNSPLEGHEKKSTNTFLRRKQKQIESGRSNSQKQTQIDPQHSNNQKQTQIDPQHSNNQNTTVSEKGRSNSQKTKVEQTLLSF